MDSPAQQPIVPITTSPGGNKNIIKIAGIVLGVVFVFVLAEAAYYFFNRSKVATPTGEKAETTTTETPVSGTANSNTDKLKKINAGFENLISIGNFYKEASLRTVAEGRVLSAEKKTTALDNFTAEYALRIQDVKANHPLTYYFTDQEVKSMNVSIVNPNGQALPARLENIQEGDLIEIIAVTNLLTSSIDDSITINILRSQ